MELFLFLFAVMPGLYLYSRLRMDGLGSSDEELEYVVAIRGILYSMPLLSVVAWFAGWKFPQLELLDALKMMSLNYKYFFVYFVVILCYAHIFVFLKRILKRKVLPGIAKATQTFTKKKAYDSGYLNAWMDIDEEYMKKYSKLVGRVIHDGKEITLGQISYLSSSTHTNEKQIGFAFQQDYKAYFPDGKAPLLENICNYFDFQTGYVLELYDGDKQVRKAQSSISLEV